MAEDVRSADDCCRDSRSFVNFNNVGGSEWQHIGNHHRSEWRGDTGRDDNADQHRAEIRIQSYI